MTDIPKTEDEIIQFRSKLIKRLTDFTTELDQKLPSKNKANRINTLSTDALNELLEKIIGIRNDLIKLRTGIGIYFLSRLEKDLKNRDLLKLSNGKKNSVYSPKALVMSLISFNKSIENFVSNKNVSNAKVYTEKVVNFEQFIAAYEKIIKKLNPEGGGELIGKFRNLMKASKQASNQFDSQASKGGYRISAAKRAFGLHKTQNQFLSKAQGNVLKEKERLLDQIGKTVVEARSIAGANAAADAAAAGTGGGGANNGAKNGAGTVVPAGANAAAAAARAANNKVKQNMILAITAQTAAGGGGAAAGNAAGGAGGAPAAETLEQTGAGGVPNPADVEANNKVQNETVNKVRSAIFRLGTRPLTNTQQKEFEGIIKRINENAIISYRTAIMSGNNNTKNQAAETFKTSLQQQNATQNLKNAVKSLNMYVTGIVGETSAAAAGRGNSE